MIKGITNLIKAGGGNPELCIPMGFSGVEGCSVSLELLWILEKIVMKDHNFMRQETQGSKETRE